MKCPSCSNELSEFFSGKLLIWVCQNGCAGLWFDHYEIKKINPINFGSGRHLLEITQVEGFRLFRDLEHVCPKCEMTILLRHFFDKKQGLEVDQCSRCGGIWIEMGKISEGKNLKINKKILFDNYFAYIYEEKIMKMDLTISDIRLAAEKILLVFRFLGMPEVLGF